MGRQPDKARSLFGEPRAAAGGPRRAAGAAGAPHRAAGEPRTAAGVGGRAPCPSDLALSGCE
eukprot:4346775-Pleurochrysis_carterae.AAC.1